VRGTSQFHSVRGTLDFGAPAVALAVALAATVTACSGTGGPEAGAPSLPGLHGSVRVVVDRGAGAAVEPGVGDGEATEVTVSARFLRYREVDRTTADMLAGGEPELGDGCQLPAGTAPIDELLASLPDGARVEHLDAGEISVVFDGVAVATTPTRLPPLSPWVDGVEYDDQVARVALTSRGTSGSLAGSLAGSWADPYTEILLSSGVGGALARDGQVSVAGFGGQHIGSFEAAIPMLDGLPEVVLDGGNDRALVVTWPQAATGARGEASGAHAETIVTVAGPTGPVCLVSGSDSVRIPAALLPPTGPLSIAVERIRRLPLAAPGLPGAELELVVRDVLAVWRP
jgi:hypothetical protein